MGKKEIRIKETDFDALGKDDAPEDLTSTMFGAFDKSTIKVAIMLFFLFIILCSDVFIDRVLASYDGLVDGRTVTEKGILTQALLISIGFIAINSLVKCGIL